MNFRNFGNEPPSDGGGGVGGRQLSGLARQTSIYSLTFDELQSTMGGGGKDFGSMNMDELLKSIWTAEETQTMAVATASSVGAAQASVGGGVPSGYLQRQGSLTLPRTISQKTVDEVWRDMSKEYGAGKEQFSVNLGSNLPMRQQTLGEMTLEEFLVKAGVVREEPQLNGKPLNGGFFGELSQSNNNNTGLGIGFQQAGQTMGMMGNRISDNSNQISIQSPNLPLNFNGVRSSQQQLPLIQSQQPQQQQQQQQQQRQPQQLFPKQPGLTYATAIPLPTSTQLGSPKIRGGMVGFSDQGMNGNMVQGAGYQQAGGMSMVGLGAGAVTLANGSPANQLSSDGIGKSNGDMSSVSPVPYVFNGGLRGRKSGAVEKVVERRQRRMIKNRESAARSRARKQAYTVELETEVAKLKEENDELRKKQAQIVEMQKNQVVEMLKQQRGGKRQCLRRTQTGPW